MRLTNILKVLFFCLIILTLFFFVNYMSKKNSVSYKSSESISNVMAKEEEVIKEIEKPKEIVKHIETPEHVKAFYMSSWILGTKNMRDAMVKIVEETELNAIVIDVKDNSGVISWQGRIKEDDLKNFINSLHEKNIYVIGRVAAFQDPLYADANKDQAVQNPDGSIWKTAKGEKWVDSGSRKMWDYLLDIGHEAYDRGFDEINYDYIRFSTDGVNQKLVYPISGADGVTGREKVITEFYKYISEDMKKRNIKISGDVFGIITTTDTDIKTLGQNLDAALTYFDYVAPMVYPSHYAAGTFGYKNPAENPGGVITASMQGAIKIATDLASTTGVSVDTYTAKLRPWYQDFDMGATYTRDMVRAQIDAGNALDIKSFMLWDPKNKYTPSALNRE